MRQHSVAFSSKVKQKIKKLLFDWYCNDPQMYGCINVISVYTFECYLCTQFMFIYALPVVDKVFDQADVERRDFIRTG